MKATFFLIGENVVQYPDVVRRTVAEGHQVACHTFSHPLLLNVTADFVTQEILKWEKAMNDINVPFKKYFRAPHGALDAVSTAAVQSLGYTIIHWSFLTGDSFITDQNEIIDVYYSHFGGASGVGVTPSELTLITQQHDTQPVTIYSFPTVASYVNGILGANGAQFVTIDDCMQSAPTPAPVPPPSPVPAPSPTPSPVPTPPPVPTPSPTPAPVPTPVPTPVPVPASPYPVPNGMTQSPSPSPILMPQSSDATRSVVSGALGMVCVAIASMFV